MNTPNRPSRLLARLLALVAMLLCPLSAFAQTGTGLTGEYYSNQNLTGAPTATRTDATVNFLWNDVPAPGLPTDHFSVNWSGQVQPEYSETYTFYTLADDGVRLWVNGVQLINDWNAHAALENSGTIQLVAGQKYDIELEFFENDFGAQIDLSWSSASRPKQIIPQARLYPTSGTTGGTGLKGEYFNNTNLTGAPALTRTDATVNFDWAGGNPGSPIGGDNYSVRWSGQVQPSVTDTFTFYTTTDDGVRLWVNGVALIDHWQPQGATEYTGTPTLTLNAGQKYDITMEYYESGGDAVAKLSWSSPLTPKAIIPSANLFPTMSGGGGEAGPISVLNLGFETPSLGGGSFEYHPAGGTWTFASAGIAANSSGFANVAAPQGTQVAFLQGSGRVSQSLSGFVADVPYTLTFSAAQRNYGQAGQTWRVILDGQVIGTYAPPQSATAYADYTAQFSTVGGTFVLEFEATNLNGGDNTVLIDNVRIVPTGGTGPDPKVTGMVIGTSGSYNDDPNSTKDKALDGLLTTFFDAPTAHGSWVGIDLGTAKIISKIRYAPRVTFAGRMVGGKFQGSNSEDFTSGVTDLFTVSSAPTEGVYTEQTVNNVNAFRYVRYLSPNDGWGNVAEIEFYGQGGTAPTLPATPSSLVATATSSSQISLTWTDNANNETGFTLERKQGVSGTYSMIATPSANATSYLDTTVAALTQYYYRIRANNGAGSSINSNEANATTPASGAPTGTGLRADYYANRDLSGLPALTRTDATVNFNWPASPGASVPADLFSVRWTGEVQPQFTETYTFYSASDDGSRLWVNGVQLVNDWFNHPLQEHSGTITLVAGQRYAITYEFYDNAGGAEAYLSWSSPSTAKAIIPSLRLYPAAGSPAPGAAFYQIIAKYWDGYGGNFASTYVYMAEPGGPANNAPVVNTITATPGTIAPGGSVNLAAGATDADGDSLQYFWVVPAGQLGWTRAATDTWKAPTIAGTYSLQVMVGDGKTWVSRYVDVVVNANGNNVSPGNHMASITSIKASKTTVAPGESITVTVTKMDPDPHPNGDFNYSWSASGGSINTAELTTGTNTWIAPSSTHTPNNRVVKQGYIVWPRLAPDQATCPFPLSTSLVGVGLTGRVSRQHFSDTWMPSWGADDALFSPWQDGALSTPPFGTLPPNNPTDGRNGWAKLVGSDPQDLMTTHAGVTNRVSLPYGGNCYPAAAFSKNGVLYYGLRNFRTLDINNNPTVWENFHRLNTSPFLGFNVSTDNGQTWTMTPHNAANPLFNEANPLHCKFGQPYMVDFGKNQDLSPDGKVYFVSNGSFANDPSVDPLNDDSIFLCRVTASVANINNIAAYEFYAGNGNWSNNLENAQPIATWANHFSGATIVYNPGLNKFLMTCYKQHFSSNNNVTHIEDDDTFILESDSLTGPYNMVTYMSSFGTQAYYPNIPSKFISSDGKTAWLWYGANFELGVKPEDPIGSGYRLTQQQIRFLTPADLDGDGDGMADAYEQSNGFNPFSPADGAEDADGDGMTNAQESIAGTSPWNPSSRLRAAAQSQSGGTILITTTAVPGKTYMLDQADTLPQWSPVPGSQRTAPVGSTQLQWTVAPPAQSSKYYWRARVLQ